MVADLEARLREALAAAPAEIIAAYLFGSQARGTASDESDVDLGILHAEVPPGTLAAQPFALADELGGLLGRALQIVVLDRAPPDLVHRVLRDGVVLLDRDRSARIRFEVAARNAYFDLLPHLERYRRTA